MAGHLPVEGGLLGVELVLPVPRHLEDLHLLRGDPTLPHAVPLQDLVELLDRGDRHGGEGLF